MKEEIEIDEKKVARLLRKIIILEKTNLNTKRFNNTEIIQKIKKMIEEEVKCY